MALRVLLADESTTIKKVMQLALQDFAVEVKAVHSGVDVLEVARQFQPDLIFADILLQKKNGYEVAADLKKDPGLSSIPVVLMWSSFMDLDEGLAEQSQADARLEKPFDVENLRQVVLKLVPRTHSQRLAHFLKFPENVTAPLKEEAKAQAPALSAPAPASAPASAPAPARTAAPAPPPAPAQKTPPPAPRSETDPTMPVNLAKPLKQVREETDPTAPIRTPPPVSRTAPPPPPPSKAAKPPARTEEPPAPKPQAQAQPQMKPQPQRTPPPPAAESKSNWNMDSFESISKFAMAEEADDDAVDLGSDEGDSEFKLANLTDRRPAQGKSSNATKTNTQAPSLDPAAGDDSEPWSHQDLSRFKVDLPPVAIEGEEFALTVDPSENGVEATDYRTNPGLRTSELEIDPGGPDLLEMPGDDRTARVDGYVSLETLEIDNAPAELELPDYALEDTAPKADDEDFGLEAGPIPQLTPERLEQIVRAQSREIIESVVRRIVPDIASEIIRQEINRLLEDSGLHDTAERETRR